MPVAPRIVNDVAYVTIFNYASFFVAGAVFGDVGLSLFVAGRSAKCCNFQYKMRLRSAKSNLGEWGRVRDDEYMVGSCSNRPRIGIDASAVFGKFFFDFGV